MRFSQGHALLIGVGTYAHAPDLNVPITVADAQALAEILRDADACGYPPEQITLLRDADATRDGILSALDGLAARAAEPDTVLLFYCGHGDSGEDGSYYLTSHDTRIAGRKVVAGSGISHQELLSKLQALRAGRVLLIFNACHSGSIGPTLGASAPSGSQSLPDEVASALLSTGAGRVIITACRASQYSYIGGGPRTIFTQALLDGLRGAGAGGQGGVISVFDLYSHIYGEVHARVLSAYGAHQEPELTILKGVGPFAVALYRGGAASGAPGLGAAPPPPAGVRQVEPEQSRELLRLAQRGGLSFGQGNQVSVQGDVVGGAQHNTRAGRDILRADTIDQRHGVTINGGSVTGTVVGFNQGTITNVVMTPGAPADPPADPLRQALEGVDRQLALAQQRGDEDLALDLQQARLALQAALKARQEGKDERRLAKQREAQAALAGLAGAHAELGALAALLA